MEEYRVRGGRALSGRVCLPAAKNSVLPILAASIMAEGEVVLEGVPDMADVAVSLALLRALGCHAEKKGEMVRICRGELLRSQLSQELAGAMRSSVFYLAPVLWGTGTVVLPLPGGCRLGPRPIDIHLDGLARMGARVSWQQRTITLRRKKPLHGVDYTLKLPSVGATETLMMAAATAEGGTVLRGVACEPEVVDLSRFLKRCGADIAGAGTPVIRVRGKESLHGCRFSPMPDRIIGSTVACAVGCAGGEVLLENVAPAQIEDVLRLLERAGCRAERRKDSVLVARAGRLRGVGRVQTAAWPGFATDSAPLAAAALLAAAGESSFCDTLFENRFACAKGFAAMGGRVRVEGRELFLSGGAELRGAKVSAPDLRGGAALVLAGLGAAGETVVCDPGHIRRGYPNLAELLRNLGADVERRKTDG